MAPSSTALALCVALLLARRTDGEKVGSPTHVRFAAEIAHHLLRWEQAHNPPGDVRYEVQHRVYGTNSSWTAIPNCMKISGHSCDLTYYTLDPALRYYARVRAVSGNHTSPWQRTNSFSPRDASLRLSGQSLSVTGNTVHVQLQLLFRVGNLTVKYDDIQKNLMQYRVYVRRAQDNQTYEVVENALEFNISNLFWDTEYCISVKPDMANRRIHATHTNEQCVTIVKRDRSAKLVLSIVSSSFIILLLLGLLGALLVCTYIKKPMRPPSVLKTFIKQSSLWVEQDSSSSGSPDTDPVQQLFLCQKEPQQHSGSDGPEPQGYKRQLPTGDDSGVGLGSTRPRPTCSSGSGNASPAEARQPRGGELSLSPAAGQDSQQDVEFRGYLQQSKGTVEPRQDPAKGMPFSGCAGSPQGPGSTDIVLDVECSELAVAKGYLKQSSPEHPRSHAQDFAPWGAPRESTAWDFSSQVELQAPSLLSYGAPGAPLASKAGPELLKAPFDLHIFNTDLLGTLPLISSLSTNEWLTLQINPLSLLNGDNKDSRL
ncbi:PREDICTED: interleukin-10 receptor subunit alpha [Pygoscelis adeliae]|uniref:interleukin-10 receptor subunit alpha n=1 Tax=Pygoscelis adeliae TaxID=9238 RepID=UPI0004F4EFE7|nr:PREDICTED: interleukin-10 receptor subunit alpha [Pygoscelis adeliae]